VVEGGRGRWKRERRVEEREGEEGGRERGCGRCKERERVWKSE
jgi:hypothetical protein